jgi:hypothetical protein
MVASYAEQTGSFHTDKSRLWCETRLPELYGLRTFDLHPDGQRFAVLKEVEEPGETKRAKVVLFENFFDEMRRLAPTK